VRKYSSTGMSAPVFTATVYRRDKPADNQGPRRLPSSESTAQDENLWDFAG